MPGVTLRDFLTREKRRRSGACECWQWRHLWLQMSRQFESQDWRSGRIKHERNRESGNWYPCSSAPSGRVSALRMSPSDWFENNESRLLFTSWDNAQPSPLSGSHRGLKPNHLMMNTAWKIRINWSRSRMTRVMELFLSMTLYLESGV